NSSIETGSGRLPDMLWTNHPAVHLIWLWEARSKQPFTGVFLHPTDVLRVTERFEKAASGLRSGGRSKEASAADQIVQHLRAINNKDGAVAVGLHTGDEAHDLMTAREERAHVIQNRIGRGDIDDHANLAKLWMEPEFRKASRYLVK